MNNRRAWQLTIVAALATSILLCVFLPAEIYRGNPLEFVSATPVLLNGLLPALLLVVIALCAPALLPAKRWRKWYAAMLAAFFFGLWASSVFMVGDFGEMDGGSFDLSRHRKTLTLQSFLFLAVLVVGWRAAYRWPGYALGVSAFLGTGLLIIAGTQFQGSMSEREGTWEPVSFDDIARFSSSKNLLIVLMDSLQSDALAHLLREEPELAGRFDGFEFFPDTLGVAPSTYLTMPGFHSGIEYNNLISVGEYYDIGVRDGSFLNQLGQAGYQVDIVNPINGTCPEASNICTRQENLLLQLEEVNKVELTKLLDLGLLRALPGMTKIWLFDGTNGPIARMKGDISLTGLELRIFQGNLLLSGMADSLHLDDGAPTARLIHLFNTHPPYMFDRKCNFIGVSKQMNRMHMNSQVECGVRWFLRLLEQMRSQGVYDNSMIVLTADTGVGNVYADDDLSSGYAEEHGLKSGKLGRLIGGANPVLTIKYPEASGAIRSSPVQAQLTDLPRTVCAALNDCSIDQGIDLRNAPAEGNVRRYHYYEWKNDYWGLNHVPGLVTYEVDGPLWFESSWSRTFSGAMPEQVLRVAFSDQDSPELFGTGWGNVESNKQGETKRWATDRKAVLYLPLPANEDLTLQFRVMGVPELRNQEMTVLVNGTKLDSRAIEDRLQEVTVSIPSKLVDRPVSTLTLEFSELTAPNNGENRRISVSFFELNIISAQAADGA